MNQWNVLQNVSQLDQKRNDGRKRGGQADLTLVEGTEVEGHPNHLAEMTARKGVPRQRMAKI